MLFSLIAATTALGAVMLLIWRAASLALPVFVAAMTLVALLKSDVSTISAFALALTAGAAILIGGQLLIAAKLPPGLRAGVVALFVLPAAFAGYGVVHAVVALASSSSVVTSGAGLIGAAMAGAAAFARLFDPADGDSMPRHATGRGR